MESVLSQVKNFKKKYPFTISWRLAAHCKIIEQHLTPGERVSYAFACQKGPAPVDLTSTCVVAITNQRLLVGQKRVLFGYSFYSLTPDLYNDLKIHTGLFWGDIIIDTVKEELILLNLSKTALPEIEGNITQFMINEKKKYASR